MKPIIVASLLALAATSANAGSWLKEEKPCAKCQAPKAIEVPAKLRGSLYNDTRVPVYESRSRIIYSSSFGSGAIDSTYRVYRR